MARSPCKSAGVERFGEPADLKRVRAIERRLQALDGVPAQLGALLEAVLQVQAQLGRLARSDRRANTAGTPTASPLIGLPAVSAASRVAPALDALGRALSRPATGGSSISDQQSSILPPASLTRQRRPSSHSINPIVEDPAMAGSFRTWSTGPRP
ncbi:unnamed protein product [Prorocentrum cordatum]|uniref:Uncharacterized protein n=1 Tax=Prorocentrum cordatum TaxID=2364126 RepID=A0ABN9TKU8_9DINO|nr:unnamed protein product [Polarella glacialis]